MILICFLKFMLFAVSRMNCKGARGEEGDQPGDHCSNRLREDGGYASCYGKIWEGDGFEFYLGTERTCGWIHVEVRECPLG